MIREQNDTGNGAQPLHVTGEALLPHDGTSKKYARDRRRFNNLERSIRLPESYLRQIASARGRLAAVLSEVEELPGGEVERTLDETETTFERCVGGLVELVRARSGDVMHPLELLLGDLLDALRRLDDATVQRLERTIRRMGHRLHLGLSPRTFYRAPTIRRGLRVRARTRRTRRARRAAPSLRAGGGDGDGPPPGPPGARAALAFAALLNEIDAGLDEARTEGALGGAS